MSDDLLRDPRVTECEREVRRLRDIVFEWETFWKDTALATVPIPLEIDESRSRKEGRYE
jgi:hypothetical protein